MRIGLERLAAAVHRADARIVLLYVLMPSRSEISLLTSNRFISRPEPVGHSILKVSP